MMMDVSQIASILALLVVIYFLSILGIKLAYNEMDSPSLAWLSTVFIFLIGWAVISNSNNPIGFVGFVPVVTYIAFKIFNGIAIDYSTKKKLKAIVLSGVSSSLVYIITHSLFGFGIPEASISAVIAAGILGSIGYAA